tara:strand:- start:36675 stop:40319 length:3645 start_codon:yes stop_codon:yes gene_type:complete
VAAVVLTRTQIATFAWVIVLSTLLLLAVPSPYAPGVAVDRHTGSPVLSAWHRLQDARGSGEVDVVIAKLAGDDPQSGHPLLKGIVELMQRELLPLHLRMTGDVPSEAALLSRALLAAADDRTGKSVEHFFRDLPPGSTGLDAQAAELRRRIDREPAPGVEELLELSSEFASRGRQRAHWRWLTRTFGLYPSEPQAVDGLIDICIAHGLLTQALAVANASGADRSRDHDHLRIRAKLGSWLGRSEVEVAALEQLVALEELPADRSRLLEIYAFLRMPDKALPHAIALADGAAEISEAEVAANTAFVSGYVDEGLSMLTRAASRAVDPTPWLQRVAEHALHDLRVDRATAELERMVAFDSGQEDHALESLYRRTDKPELLADLLERRVLREPANAKLWDEVVGLRYALGQSRQARQLEVRRNAAIADPQAFLETLPSDVRAQATAIRRQALSMALAADQDATLLGNVLERLRPFLQEPQFRDAAEALLIRYKNDPAARSMRVEMVDLGRTPEQSTLAAADLAATYPDDVELIGLWVERASWAGMTAAEVDARRALLKLQPHDLNNRHALADLLAFAGDTESAVPLWRQLVDEEGIVSAAVPMLVESLFELGREPEALQLLEQLATDSAATNAHRMRAADELFYRRSYDRAKVLYASLLREEPTHLHALLRLGQIHAWSNDPVVARGYLERRLAASEQDGALVRFYLGESLWVTGEPARARQLQVEALAELEGLTAPDFTTRSIIATMLARVGRNREAVTAYRDLVAHSPRDLDLVLDYVDVLVTEGKLDMAVLLLQHGASLDADNQRLLRLLGELETQRGNTRVAEQVLTRAIELHGADAGISADLGGLRYQMGDWRGALASYERWLQLQSDNQVAQRVVGELRDRLAATVVPSGRSLSLGDDRVREATIGAIVPIDNTWQLNLRAGHAEYTGAAQAFAGAKRTTKVGILDLAAEANYGDSMRWGFGMTAAPGAPGNLALGGFATAYFADAVPFASLELRGYFNELWTEPAAAPALNGRRSGLDAQLYRQLPADFWFGAAGAVERLSIDPPLSDPFADLRWRGEVTFGRRFVGTELAVASRFQPRRVPSRPSSPFLFDDAENGERWAVSAWASVQVMSLIGDADLPALLPIADSDQQAFVAGRVDHRLAPGLGCSVSGNVGVDLDDGEQIWGANAALTWRPRPLVELSVALRHASALGRAGGGEVDELHVEGVLRW